MDSASSGQNIATTVAVIDIGSNSIRMVIAQVMPDGSFDLLERTQQPVLLGRDTFVRGKLRQQTMNAAVAVLRDYRKIIDTYQVQQVRTVATSAVREATNSDGFMDRILMATNLEVEIIDPSEESRLIVSSVRQIVGEETGLIDDWTLIANVGGGSVLLSVLEAGKMVLSESFKLGSIRLQEILSITNETPQRAADLLRYKISSILAAGNSFVPLKKIQSFIAVGGDVRFAARLIGRPVGPAGLSVIDRESFYGLIEDCVSHSDAQLARKYTIPVADAETIVPALLVYQLLLEETQAGELYVADISMRDGLLLDISRRVVGAEDQELGDSTIRSALNIGEKFRYDAAHGELVAANAEAIFEAIQRLHGLSNRHRLLLKLAGILHEIGTHVNARGHHKHSLYLIENSEIFGLSRQEQSMVANIARYHRRTAPKSSHIDYISLPREQRMVVSKLAAILRIADALDHGHSQHIQQPKLELRADELVIYMTNIGDITLEQRAVSAKSDLFGEIYGLKVRVAQAGVEMARLSKIGSAFF